MENVKFLEIKSRYNEQKQHCSLAGTFMICGIEGRFEVHTIGSCCTRVTGRVSLISPLDGKILLFDGARRRELIAKRAEDQKARIRTEKRPRELKATKELDVEIAGVDLDPMTHVVVFPQSANTAIKEAVAGKAERLYAEAQPTLARILENHGLGQNATALGLFYARSKAFFATEVPTKEQTRRRNQNSLQKICASLGDKPISCISAKDVTYLSKQFSNTELRRTSRFFDFCKDRGDFACANPILEYMPTQKHTRNYSAERARAARMHGISGEAECALLKLAKDHIADVPLCSRLAQGWGSTRCANCIGVMFNARIIRRIWSCSRTTPARRTITRVHRFRLRRRFYGHGMTGCMSTIHAAFPIFQSSPIEMIHEEASHAVR